MGMNYQDEILYISTRIKELRKERKLTVQELAYRCDMERSNLSRIEAGRTNLTVKTICSICNALSVNMRDVIRYRCFSPAAKSCSACNTLGRYTYIYIYCA